ncbi:hypothetical protein ASZ90_003599 [hydrocarbon metagenome]|uniref:Uncharacterized protein n=1 Tax=hydrocarbon metagenome TaxID=938273 RepID=A0A0W8G0L2_9ZZZZ
MKGCTLYFVVSIITSTITENKINKDNIKVPIELRNMSTYLL